MSAPMLDTVTPVQGGRSRAYAHAMAEAEALMLAWESRPRGRSEINCAANPAARPKQPEAAKRRQQQRQRNRQNESPRSAPCRNAAQGCEAVVSRKGRACYSCASRATDRWAKGRAVRMARGAHT